MPSQHAESEPNMALKDESVTDLPADNVPTPQISVSAKERINREEQYRLEVRQQLEDTKSTRPGVLSFLNSGFALWLLSAVFLSGTGTVYSCWEKDREATRVKHDRETDVARLRAQTELALAEENRITIEKLDTEISYRFSLALLSLRSVTDDVSMTLARSSVADREIESIDSAERAVHSLGRLPTGDQASLYPQYATYTLPALIAELHRHVPIRERPQIEQSLAKLLVITLRPTLDAADPARALASRLLGDIMLPRWKKTGFYYVDCKPANPFC